MSDPNATQSYPISDLLAVAQAAIALRDVCKQELGVVERIGLKARKPDVAAKLAELEAAVKKLEAK